MATIISVYKSDRMKLIDYRPISLISKFGKILEKIIQRRIVSFLSKYKILADNQYGSRDGLSTTDATARLIGLINSSIAAKKSLCIFLDLVNAFYMVKHHQLVSLLENLSIKGTSLKLIKSYLYDRNQCVQIEVHHTK